MEHQIAKARRVGARPGLIRHRYASDARLAALIRRGDVKAFEALYDRYSHDVLLFCASIVHSRADAEDAVQATFASAFRALPRDEREIELRRWLFVVARNASLSILRRRTSTQQVEDCLLPPAADAAEVAERRESVDELLATIKQLPENQRTSLVLAEILDMSHAEIGAVIDVPPAKVKAYVHQARLTLAAERDAIGADCAEIRRELEGARGAGLLKGRLRRHLRHCERCSDYAETVRSRRAALGLLLPIAPALGLRHRVLAAAKATQAGCAAGGTAGASFVGATADLLGVAGKGLVAKLLVGVATVGVGAGAGAVVVDAVTPPAHGGPQVRLADTVHDRAGVPSTTSPSSGGGLTHTAPSLSQSDAATGSHSARQSPSGSSPLTGSTQAGGIRQTPASGKGPGKGASETRGKSSEPHGESAQAPGKGGRQRGRAAEAKGRQGEPRGNGGSRGHSSESHGESAGSHAGSAEPHGKSSEPHPSAPAAQTRPAGGESAAPTPPTPPAGPASRSEPAPEHPEAKAPGGGTGHEGAGPHPGKP